MLLRASLRALHISAAAGGPARASAAPTAALAMGKKSHYAVAVGRKTGLFTSWDECRQHVQGFAGSTFKGFASEQEARAYLAQHGVTAPPPLARNGEADAAAAAAATAGGRSRGAAAAAALAEPTLKRRAPGSRTQRASAAAAAAATGVRFGVTVRPTSAANGPVFRLVGFDD